MADPLPHVLVSHPFGNPNAYQVARGLHIKSCLVGFATCMYEPWGTSFRSDKSLPKGTVKTYAWREGLRMALAHSRIWSQTGRSAKMIDWVACAHDRWVSRQLTRDTNIIWGYEDFAASSFARAKALAIRTIYDLPTIHHLDARLIHQREVDMDPSLAPFLSPSLEPEHRLRRKLVELNLADVVVCASSFVKASLIRRGLPASKLRVLPYGATVPSMEPTAMHRKGPLRLLYVGSIGPHKGIHHLFQAVREFPRSAVHLSLAGQWVPGFRNWIERRFTVPFRDAGRLSATRLSAEYRNADVLVFPALRDGFGLVLVEAMAHGLPVIASTSCAAPDLIRDGVEGWLVPPSNPERLREAIGTLVDHPHLAPAMGDAAYQLSRKLTWEKYHSQVWALSQRLIQAAQLSA